MGPVFVTHQRKHKGRDVRTKFRFRSTVLDEKRLFHVIRSLLRGRRTTGTVLTRVRRRKSLPRFLGVYWTLKAGNFRDAGLLAWIVADKSHPPAI
jgi:hypothetical protein